MGGLVGNEGRARRPLPWLQTRPAVEKWLRALSRQSRPATFDQGIRAGRVSVVARADLAKCEKWATAFSHDRKDNRYYEIVEDTLHPEIVHRYLIVRDVIGAVCAIQPFFLLDLDLTEGVSRGVKSSIRIVRRVWPRFMYARTLMMGCVAGEGRLDGDPQAQPGCEQLARTLVEQARLHRARLVVFKEFSAQYRDKLRSLQRQGFVRVASLPITSLDIAYADFGEYMTRVLSRSARKDLRRKHKVAQQAAPITLEVLCDATSCVQEIYPLYLQVYERSCHHFEKLTPEFLCQLGQRMPDKARFFIWRQNGRVVAFSLCLVQGDTISDEFIGLDYSVALDLHLYHYTFRDIISWAIAQGYCRYCSNGLNYDPKLHLGCRLDPLDLYVRHTSDAANTVFKLVLPWLDPTRYDRTLRRFPNYHELRDDR